MRARINPAKTTRISGSSPNSVREVGFFVEQNRLQTLYCITKTTLFQISRGLTQVVIRDELNRRVETSMRATANSLSSLGVRLVFAGLGPLLGWAIEHRGHGLAYLSCAGLWLASALLLAAPLAWSLRRTATSPE